MIFATYASIAALLVGALLVAAVVWLGRKYDEATERDNWDMKGE
jgi:hypothetical protein